MPFFIDGFDHYNTFPQANVKWGTASAGFSGSAFSALGGGPFGYGRSVTLGDTASMQLTNITRFGAAANSPNWLVGFYLNLSVSASGERTFFRLRDGSTTQIEVRFEFALNAFRFYRGTTLLDSVITSYAPGNWGHLCLYIVVNNTTGSIKASLNGGAAFYTFSGNTRNSTNNYATNLQLVGSSSGFLLHSFDDFFAVWGEGAPYNDLIQPRRVYFALPDGAGALTEWTPSTGSNWQNVDENPPNDDTDYNSSSTPGQIDTFTQSIGTIPAPDVVQVTSYVRKDDAGTRTLRNVIRSGSTNAESGDITVASSYEMQTRNWQQSPFTSSAWGASEVQNLQVGYKIQA